MTGDFTVDSRRGTSVLDDVSNGYRAQSLFSHPVAAVETPEYGPVVNTGRIQPCFYPPRSRRPEEQNHSGSFLIGFRVLDRQPGGAVAFKRDVGYLYTGNLGNAEQSV